VALQATLYEDVTRASAAKFHTPFFIRPEQGFGDFWLLHRMRPGISSTPASA